MGGTPTLKISEWEKDTGSGNACAQHRSGNPFPPPLKGSSPLSMIPKIVNSLHPLPEWLTPL